MAQPTIRQHLPELQKSKHMQRNQKKMDIACNICLSSSSSEEYKPYTKTLYSLLHGPMKIMKMFVNNLKLSQQVSKFQIALSIIFLSVQYG